MVRAASLVNFNSPLIPRTSPDRQYVITGTEYTDTVTLGTGLVITKQSIGVAKTATGFDGVDGILGIGPVDLTSGMYSLNCDNPFT